jgi:hypothetical protein
MQQFPQPLGRQFVAIAHFRPLGRGTRYRSGRNSSRGTPRKRPQMTESAAAEREVKVAAAENPAAARLFEIRHEDGRTSRQPALNVASLRTRLSKDWTITAEVFPGGVTRPIDPSQPTFSTASLARSDPSFAPGLPSKGSLSGEVTQHKSKLNSANRRPAHGRSKRHDAIARTRENRNR